MVDIKDGTACVHRACLSHKTYPCPFCGRIAGRELTHSEKIVDALMKHFTSTEGGTWSDEEWFEEALEVVKPIVEEAFTGGVMVSPETEFPINTEQEAKRCMEAAIADDFRFNHRRGEARPWVTLATSEQISKAKKRVNWLKVIWSCLTAPFIFSRQLLRDWKTYISALDRDLAAMFRVSKTLLGLPVYAASSKREAQERRDHYWATKIMPRLREYLKEHGEG